MNPDIQKYNYALTSVDQSIAEMLATEISKRLPKAENKIWHAHPVWFIEGNPIVGYDKLKDSVRLLFWSNNQNLANPQSLNSYIYAEGSPIGKKDPDGRAAYIWNNGAGMTGMDTKNTNTYYEWQDQAMLAGNVGYMQSLSGSGLLRNIVFAYKEREGGDWDYKRNEEGRGSYFFNGELVPKESFGNIHYGYVGTAAGYGPTTLKVVGGAVHIATSIKSGGKTKIGSANSYFDDARDTKNISKGINTYNSKQSKSISNASASLSSASAAIARGDYSGAIKSLQSASNSLGKNKK